MGLATVAKVAMDWTMSVLEHHVLILKEISGTVLGSWDNFFCWVLVFVILTFFKEGIGNNLTMPSWGLGNGSWDLGLRELVTGNW